MVPNFNDELNLKNSSRTVAAGGPCNWQTGDKSRRKRILNVHYPKKPSFICQQHILAQGTDSDDIAKA